ncbi:MAG: alpha-L-arabinofuranosidase, partial [Verrucomicrobiota bacterium]
EKITAALKAWNPPGMIKIINIVGWPEWIRQDKDHRLDKSEYDAFAAFCADLVRIVNVEGGLGVQYFEVTNEKDGLYWIEPMSNKQPDQVSELAEIYNRAAIAMKKVDPKIKVGGPAAMRPDGTEPLFRWVKAVQPNLDFLSVHMYASGNSQDPDIQIFDRTESMGEASASLRKSLDAASPDRKIELHVNEFNISWTWETHDARMGNHLGAVFDALSLVQLATHGTDIMNAWNECDGTYGKMDGAMKLRPPAQTYHLFNRFLVGNRVAVSTSQPHRVVPMAVKGEQGDSLLLINRNSKDREVVLNLKGWKQPAAPVKISRIQASGFTEEQPFQSPGLLDGKAFMLPANSVTVLHWQN